MHHPFTVHVTKILLCWLSDPGKVYAKAYDMVLNGTEIGGGSIRIHRRDVQNEVFQGYRSYRRAGKREIRLMMDAFEYGAASARRFGLWS